MTKNAFTKLIEIHFKHTKGNELNTCLWGEEQNTVMHLAYLINQPDLTQLLMDKGALINIPNKSGHLPIKQVANDKDFIAINDEVTVTDAAAPTPTVSDKSTASLQEDSQPEVKLLINKSKSAAAANKERIPVNTSDRFKRLRELAESPGANNNKPISERQNSTRRYFRPGHLEERRRRVLSEEEEAELEKQRLKRQKEVDMLAQRSAVKNNPLFKKFEEQTQGQQQQQGKPVISAVSAIRDRKKLLGAADQIRRTSRVINSLKDRSYVSGSVFRQQSDTATESGSTENNLRVPTLAQLRAGPPTSTSISRETSLNVSDNEEEEEKSVKNEIDSSKITPSTQKQIPITPTKESFASSTVVTNDTAIDQKKIESSAATIETSLDSSVVIKNKSLIDGQKENVKLSTTSLKSTNDVNGVTTTAKAAENDIESLSIGKLSNVNREVKSSHPSKSQVGSSKVKQIVNVHEHLNEETEIENYSTGKIFSVWKKNEYGDLIEETQEKSFTDKGIASEGTIFVHLLLLFLT